MNRRHALRRSGIAAVLAAGSAPAVHAQPVVRWRLASSFPRSLDTIHGAAEVFAQQVRAMSGGRFQISVHAPGELMPAFGVVDGVQQGQVEACHTAPYYFVDKDEAFAIGAAIPFGLTSRQMSAWMFQGNGLQLMREFYAGYGFTSFPGGNTGAQMGGWFRREIRSAADVKGLRMRIAGFAARIVEPLGCVPYNLPGGDIHAALQQGRIDAAEWVGPYDDWKLGLQKVAPYYYYPGWWEGGLQVDFFVNLRAYEALSAEYKAILAAASGYTHVDMQARYDARNPVALKQLVAAGARLRPFPGDMMTAAFRVARAIYADLSARNPAWRKIYADYARFRADQNVWFRFTEATFDRFMQSQRL